MNFKAYIIFIPDITFKVKIDLLYVQDPVLLAMIYNSLANMVHHEAYMITVDLLISYFIQIIIKNVTVCILTS